MEVVVILHCASPVPLEELYQDCPKLQLAAASRITEAECRHMWFVTTAPMHVPGLTGLLCVKVLCLMLQGVC